MPMADFRLSLMEPGTKAAFQLEAFATPAGTATVPILAVQGKKDGPVLMAVAGVHGDEFEGMAAIRRVCAELDPGAMSGSFVAIPVCNIFAYEGLSRASPAHVDGLNMARVFPGDRYSDPTRRLAYHVFELTTRLLTPDDLFVDFHSSGSRYQYEPMIGFVDMPGPVLARSEAAARHFGIDLVWGLNPDPMGRFNSQTTRAGIPTVGTEIFGNGGCRPEDVAVYAQGLCNLLRFQGILSGAPPRCDAPAAHFRYLYVDECGFLEPCEGVGLSRPVRAGQVLARVLDPLGAVLGNVVSPCSGRIVAIRTFCAIWTGDIAFLILPD